jgi:predicted ATPase
MTDHFLATKICHCYETSHRLRKIVITGGPGAGKSALVEMARMQFCPHVALLPEAATILFQGGFWRENSIQGREVAQRAIFHIQKELEYFVFLEKKCALAICDRGTLDGLAYWPKSRASFFKELSISHKEELLSYSAVIHLRTPPPENGYNRKNPVRMESAEEAMEMDAKIETAWEGHPRRFFIESTGNFMEKAEKALQILRKEIPKCCMVPEKWSP